MSAADEPGDRFPKAPAAHAPGQAADQWASAPAPELPSRIIEAALAERWRITGRLTRLYGERDLNFRLDTECGQRFLLKVAHPGSSAALLDFQNRALLHAGQMMQKLPLPRLQADRDGALTARFKAMQLRLFSWLPGKALDLSGAPLTAAAALGSTLAQLADALVACPQDGAPDQLAWDLQNFLSLAPLLPRAASALGHGGAAPLLASAFDRYERQLAPALRALPRQVVHNDLNPDNLLFDPADPRHVTGVIDFGDALAAPRVCDLAIAASYLLSPRASEPLARVVHACRAYQRAAGPGRALTESELALLPGLISTRLATTVLIQGFRHARAPQRSSPEATAARRALEALQWLHQGEALAEQMSEIPGETMAAGNKADSPFQRLGSALSELAAN